MNNRSSPPGVFCDVRWYSQKFRKIDRETPVPEYLFNKVAGLRPTSEAWGLQHLFRRASLDYSFWNKFIELNHFNKP